MVKTGFQVNVTAQASSFIKLYFFSVSRIPFKVFKAICREFRNTLNLSRGVKTIESILISSMLISVRFVCTKLASDALTDICTILTKMTRDATLRIRIIIESDIKCGDEPNIDRSECHLVEVYVEYKAI